MVVQGELLADLCDLCGNHQVSPFLVKKNPHRHSEMGSLVGG